MVLNTGGGLLTARLGGVFHVNGLRSAGMNGCVAVFDLGKTNIKVIAFDRAGKVLAERACANAPLEPDAHCPYLRLDTERAWTFLVAALQHIGASVLVEAISITTHGASGVL